MKKTNIIYWAFLACLLGLSLLWAFHSPEIPATWACIHRGMKKREVYSVLGIPSDGGGKVYEKKFTEYLGANPIIFRKDAILEVYFTQSTDSDYLSMEVDRVEIVFLQGDLFTRAKNRYKIYGFRLWKW